MKKVQKRMTRMLPDLKNMSYPERLKILGLTTLESHRLRGDLIEIFKIVKGFDNIDRNIFFHRDIEVCRGHSEKLHNVAVITRPRNCIWKMLKKMAKNV